LYEFIRENIDTVPIFEILPNEIPGYYLVPAGIGYKISKNKDEAIDPKYWDFSFHDEDFSQAKDIQEKYNSSWIEMLNGYISAYKNLGDYYLWKKQSYKEASLYYAKALKVIDKYDSFQKFEPTFKSNILVTQGQAFLGENKFVEADKNFDAAVELNPLNASAYISKGQALERLDKAAQAADYYRRALLIDPENEIARVLIERLRHN
jgi:tetratricopeptide (TPR) repeat protein